MAEVVWAEPGLNDLRAIVEHIAEDSPAYAERFALKVVGATKRLKQFPRSGRTVPEYGDETIRELIYGSYRIIYLMRSHVCHVVAVVHGSRRLLRELGSGEWEVR